MKGKKRVKKKERKEWNKKRMKRKKRILGVVGVLRRTAAFRGYRGMGDWQESEIQTQKKRPGNGFLSLVRGRLPTLPLSQYHRRGEA